MFLIHNKQMMQIELQVGHLHKILKFQIKFQIKRIKSKFDINIYKCIFNVNL